MKTRKHITGAVASALIATFSQFLMADANAADGCKFLLCIAGPWRSIGECVPTVNDVFKDLAKGRGFPTCDMAGSNNVAWNNWTSEASCPAMYRRYSPRFNTYIGCKYTGQISVQMNGQPWSTVFWNTSGATSTAWADQALQSFAAQTNPAPVDMTYSNDLAAWNAAQAAAAAY